MPNLRGSTYSRNHTTLDPCASCTDFWDFALEESAVLDYPTVIDFILAETGHPDLHFAGYSMGTTHYLILLSERPEYNAKIRSGHLLGPTAFGGNGTNPFIAPLAGHAEVIRDGIHALGLREFMPNLHQLQAVLFGHLCHTSSAYLDVCTSIFSLAAGMDFGRLNKTLVPLYMTHMPGGASVSQFVHFAQLFRNGGEFVKFDHGAEVNRMRYGAEHPPKYDVGKVTAPTALYVGDADGFATEADSLKLAGRLGGPVIHHEVVAAEGWTHIDFILAVEAGELVNRKVVDLIVKRDLEMGSEGV